MCAQHHETNPYFGLRNQVQERPSRLATTQHAQPQLPPQPVPSEMPHRLDPNLWPSVPPTGRRPPRKTRRQDQGDRHRDSERHKPLSPSGPIGAWSALVPEVQHQSAPTEATEQNHEQGHAQHSGTQPQVTQPKRQRRQQPERHRHGLVMLTPRRTTPIAWFLAGFCAIFWIVIILGGLIVLIVYLVFRPHNPSFDVSGVTLNAAYLDVDVMLNADLTVLAKFTNPNKKVKVDFSYVVLDLYYRNTMIASQYIEPFRAARLETKLANVHMISSQVRLPLEETERLRREIERNAITFQVKGVFRARSSLGSFLRYSYRLYGHCTIVVTGPPTGVIKAVQCKTKR